MLIYLQPPPKNVSDLVYFAENFAKKLRYFRLLPNLARQRKLIDLANHLPSSSPCGLLTVTHRAFENFEFYGESRGIFGEPILK